MTSKIKPSVIQIKLASMANIPPTKNVMNALLSDRRLELVNDMKIASSVYFMSWSKRELPVRSRELRKIERLMDDLSATPEKKAVLWLLTRRFQHFADGRHCCGSAFSKSTSIQLVDFMPVRRNIRRNHAPGWDRIPRLDTYDIRNNFGSSMRMIASDLEHDVPEHLIIHLAVNGMNLTRNILKLAMRNEAVRTLTFLLKTRFDEVAKLIKPEDMLFFACANPFKYTSEECRDIIAELENNMPGIVARTTDPFGYNALWYTLRDERELDATKLLVNDTNGEIDETNSNELRGYLTELGCDPLATNHLGLSFQLCKDVEKELARRCTLEYLRKNPR